MSAFKTLIAAVLLSTATISSASAAWSFADQEPAAFASMYPNRDVLNGGALTPAGRMGLERSGGAAPVFGAGHIYNRHGIGERRQHAKANCRVTMPVRDPARRATAPCGAPRGPEPRSISSAPNVCSRRRRRTLPQIGRR